MKYFKKIAEHPGFGKNEEKSWQAIVKLFWGDREIPQHYFTSISDTLNRIREEYWIDQRKKNMRESIHEKPSIEDNSYDTNY